MDDKFRRLLRLSIVFFFTLAIFFFLMIFLLSLAKKHTLKNEINDKVPIQQQEYATWGQIPGDLKYSYTRTYNLYEFAYNITSQAAEINLNTVGEYDFEVERIYSNATWYPQKSVVAYNQTYDYTLRNSAVNADDTVFTINMGSYNVWYQMCNKPRYFQAWQALTTAYNVVSESNFLTRFYAYNVLEFFFTSYSEVQTYVLPSFDEAAQSIIYNDPKYGLNSIQGLT